MPFLCGCIPEARDGRRNVGVVRTGRGEMYSSSSGFADMQRKDVRALTGWLEGGSCFDCFESFLMMVDHFVRFFCLKCSFFGLIKDSLEKSFFSATGGSSWLCASEGVGRLIANSWGLAVLDVPM
jgi:hypothetical protein